MYLYTEIIFVRYGCGLIDLNDIFEMVQEYQKNILVNILFLSLKIAHSNL